ncbi:diguanylate cyclase [Paracoccus pacificus]|uniref:diguanylate cyclase n=1 Tax=Paracoccus pacificus TaxID=1463598 RepID=A0ABW4R567_9RHOB
MMGRPVILIVDDEISNIEMIGAVLEDSYEVRFARSGEEALLQARATPPDLVLLDIVMPGMDGYELCRRLKQDEVLADVPVIFTTGLFKPEDEVRGFEAGAIDYVTKPIQPLVLQSRVRNHVELKRMRDQLADLAMTDALTGLGNRRLLEKLLPSEARRLARDGDWLSYLMLDIDFFKQFNDIYGHPKGDDCLRAVADQIRAAMRRSNDVGLRYGGEEFACILPKTDPPSALHVAESMRRQVEELAIPHSRSKISPFVTVSIGVASGRCIHGLSEELWITTADAMLYECKRTGRNQTAGHIIEPPRVESAFLRAERRVRGASG